MSVFGYPTAHAFQGLYLPAGQEGYIVRHNLGDPVGVEADGVDPLFWYPTCLYFRITPATPSPWFIRGTVVFNHPGIECTYTVYDYRPEAVLAQSTVRSESVSSPMPSLTVEMDLPEGDRVAVLFRPLKTGQHTSGEFTEAAYLLVTQSEHTKDVHFESRAVFAATDVDPLDLSHVSDFEEME